MATAEKKQHPFCDFLTDEIKQFLRDVANKKLNGQIVNFYGSGSNGKSCFIDVLKKVFNCVLVPSSTFTDKKATSFYEKEIRGKNLDIVMIQECEKTDLEQFVKNENLADNDFCILVSTNYLLDDIKIDPTSLKKLNPIKVIEFKNEYYNNSEFQENKNPLQKATLKASQSIEEIVNDDAVRIVKDIIKYD